MSQLFTAFKVRDMVLKNRLVVSPMCQYSAVNGQATDWHLAHLGRMALGGFGLVIVEATAVTADGRISYADVGLWDDEQIAPLKRVADFLQAHGSKAGIQLAHAGRKASTLVPWRNDLHLSDAEKTAVGFETWQPVGPSAMAHAAGFEVPAALDEAGMKRILDGFVSATRRAERAGFDMVEVHAAHGYLLNQFISPLANKRQDQYGGSLENRLRYPLAVIAAVRAAWPKEKPLFLRVSAVDASPEGVQLEDSIVFARQAKQLGVDVIDCSSGGFAEGTFTPAPLYQVAYAAAIRREAKIATMCVGLIAEADQAEKIIAQGDADLVALGRAALDDPNWPAHARHQLDPADDFSVWPVSSGFAVKSLYKMMGR